MKVFLYGIGSASEAYRVHYYRWLEDEDISFLRIRDDAEYMRARNPSIQHVYAIFDRRGLLWDYREAVKKNSVESWQVFKSILEYEGMIAF